MFARIAVALVLLGGVARAQPAPAADGGTPSPPSPPQQQQQQQSAHVGSPIAQALDQFDFGDYEGVVQRLRPMVDAADLSRQLPQKADRLEALRIYGIACTLTDRKTSAEGAFILLLREEPSTRLDPALVRPEAVAFFEQVRARHHDELVAAYRKTRPRYYWPLDLVPVYGQIQNRQWRKAMAFGLVDLTLLAGNIATYWVLDYYGGTTRDFMAHGDKVSLQAPLQALNIACFVGLGVTVGWGIIDAFVVGKKRQERERQIEARIGF